MTSSTRDKIQLAGWLLLTAILFTAIDIVFRFLVPFLILHSLLES